MFSHCQGHPGGGSQSGNLSVHGHSSSHYYHGGSNHGINHQNQPRPPSNFFSFCLQGVCGADPSSLSAGRKYSTTMEDNSSIIATHNNLNFEDDCRITLNRFKKKGANGKEVLFIQAWATLTDDEVDEAHDLLYLVRMPEVVSGAASSTGLSPDELPHKK